MRVQALSQPKRRSFACGGDDQGREPHLLCKLAKAAEKDGAVTFLAVALRSRKEGDLQAVGLGLSMHLDHSCSHDLPHVQWQRISDTM